MSEGGKAAPAIGIQMPETKTTFDSATTMSGPLVAVSGGGGGRELGRTGDTGRLALRLICLLTSLGALGFMLSAQQSSSIFVLGFQLPLYSKWSFSDSFEFLVVMSLAVAAHSVLQLAMNMSKLVKKLPIIPSTKHAWILFAGDQVFAYAMISAGSASASVANLNSNGIRHSSLPDFCKPLNRFCDRATVSIVFAFLTCFMLACSAILDVFWLSMH